VFVVISHLYPILNFYGNKTRMPSVGSPFGL
jgi:hypothetical protein